MSFRSSVVSTKCCFVQLSFQSSVVLINCRFNQMLFQSSVVRSSVVRLTVVRSGVVRSTVGSHFTIPSSIDLSIVKNFIPARNSPRHPMQLKILMFLALSWQYFCIESLLGAVYLCDVPVYVSHTKIF